MEAGRLLNRRKEDRYWVDEIPLEGMGAIVEISKNGLKVRKAPGFAPEETILSFPLADLEIKAAFRWQDNNFFGLEVDVPFENPDFFIEWIIRPEETMVRPRMKIQPDRTMDYVKRDEGLIGMINLLLEVDGPDPDIKKIARYIDEICTLQESEKEQEIKAAEEENPGKKEKSCKDELIARALELQGDEKSEAMDVNFAITILGLSKMGEIIKDHINKEVFHSGNPLSLFQNFEIFKVLKSVVFKNLCRFFGLQDIQPEGSTLLALETNGVALLIKESKGLLDHYYHSPTRLYSEFSRMYEKTFFAIDTLQINQHCFEDLGTLGELFNGYLLAHQTLHPDYFPSEELKVSLNKNGLIFSYLVYLTYLAVQFLMDKDRESGFVLSRRLKGRGMGVSKIDQFLETSVTDTKTISRNLKLKGSLSKPSLPDGLTPIESYLGNDIRFRYLLQTFRDFSLGPTNRMALRYDDVAYAHFILGKLMNSESLALNSKTVCVIPCANVSSDQWYINDFAYFDLIAFKEIHKLPAHLLSAFLKLWSTFEGQIIATFSGPEMLDYTNPGLYKIFNSYLVDFPSCCVNNSIYEKMIDQTLQYLLPYLGNQAIDRSRYLPGPFTMNHIKADILQTKEIL